MSSPTEDKPLAILSLPFKYIKQEWKDCGDDSTLKFLLALLSVMFVIMAGMVVFCFVMVILAATGSS